MSILLGTVFLASLLGSLHCVGMCGPFALLASYGRDQRKAAVVPTFAYSFGRLVTYSIVGLIFGTLGMALNKGVAFTSWQQSATYTAGALMIIVGLISLVRFLGLRIRLPQFFSPMQKFLQRAYARTTELKPLPRAFAIGALTSLMPCGWLYTFAITAAGTGSPLWGMFLMISFWTGTVPIMTALMLGFNQFGKRVQQHLPLVMASLVIALGIFTIGFRAPIVVGEQTNVVSGVDNLTKQVIEIEQSDLSCCH